MNKLLFGFLSAATLLTFGLERYAALYSGHNEIIGVPLCQLRVLFFQFFVLQVVLPLYHWLEDPKCESTGLSGFLLFVSIVAAALAFFIYDIPMAALNLLVTVARMVMAS